MSLWRASAHVRPAARAAAAARSAHICSRHFSEFNLKSTTASADDKHIEKVRFEIICETSDSRLPSFPVKIAAVPKQDFVPQPFGILCFFTVGTGRGLEHYPDVELDSPLPG